MDVRCYQNAILSIQNGLAAYVYRPFMHHGDASLRTDQSSGKMVPQALLIPKSYILSGHKKEMHRTSTHLLYTYPLFF